MSLTDREKEIALEVAHRRCKTYRHKAEEPYSFDDYCMIHAFDTFLSRIREEQEAVAWVYEAVDGRTCHRNVARLPEELGGNIDLYPDTWDRKYPLFTTPPAAPCDCSELVEALTRLSNAVTMQRIVTEQESIALRMANKRAQEVLANHAKRMNGEE